METINRSTRPTEAIRNAERLLNLREQYRSTGQATVWISIATELTEQLEQFYYEGAARRIIAIETNNAAQLQHIDDLRKQLWDAKAHLESSIHTEKIRIQANAPSAAPTPSRTAKFSPWKGFGCAIGVVLLLLLIAFLTDPPRTPLMATEPTAANLIARPLSAREATPTIDRAVEYIQGVLHIRDQFGPHMTEARSLMDQANTKPFGSWMYDYKWKKSVQEALTRAANDLNGVYVLNAPYPFKVAHEHLLNATYDLQQYTTVYLDWLNSVSARNPGNEQYQQANSLYLLFVREWSQFENEISNATNGGSH